MLRIPFHRHLLFLIVTCLGATIAAAQSKAPLSAEKMWSLQRLADPAISPDGRLAVVPVTRYDVAENKGLTDLWLIPTAGGPARQLTSDAAPDTQPVFSPDGRWIAFVSKRTNDEQNQIYVIAVDGGEARRVKLAKELSRKATGRTLYILDEPTTGLHFHDVAKLLEVLHELVDQGNTVIVIEHNLEVIKTADWILDLGPEGGDGGGELVVAGTIDDVMAEPRSYTGRFLKELLERRRKEGKQQAAE